MLTNIPDIAGLCITVAANTRRPKPVVVNAKPDSRREPDRATLSARDASPLLRCSSD